MPLHLLGKKSWNVYGGENIDRVRRDEAAAQAREEAEEQRMQGEDAARRMATLRGVPSPAVNLSDGSAGGVRLVKPDVRARDADGDASRVSPRERKRRRLRGEDDTDRDIRFAREDHEAGQKARGILSNKAPDDAPLLDHAGHLQLIPAPDGKAIRKAEKNAEAEADKERKRKRDEDQYTLRFSNAAGFKNGPEKPWWASNKPAEAHNPKAVLPHVQDQDAWGNEDGRRKERELARINTHDPLAAMGLAQRQLKMVERQRRELAQERKVDVDEVKAKGRRALMRERRWRQRKFQEENELVDFSLDAPPLDDDEPRRQRDARQRRHGERRRRHDEDERGREREYELKQAGEHRRSHVPLLRSTTHVSAGNGDHTGA